MDVSEKEIKRQMAEQEAKRCHQVEAAEVVEPSDTRGCLFDEDAVLKLLNASPTSKESREIDDTPLCEMTKELLVHDIRSLTDRAQAMIDAVNRGDAASVGLGETAVMASVLHEFFLLEASQGLKVNRANRYERLNRLTNTFAKLNLQLKQSAAWSFRAQNVVTRADGLGRNNSRVEARILKRATTSGDGGFDESL